MHVCGYQNFTAKNAKIVSITENGGNADLFHISELSRTYYINKFELGIINIITLPPFSDD